MSGEGEAKDFLSRAQEGIGTRFQSQATIEKANEQRDKDWQAAYARLGQEPPKNETEYVHDGRTLYERLELNKKLNEEEWDAKMKLGNQYRGLDAEEIGFLNARKAEQRAKEQAIREDEQRGLAEYRQALAARQATALAEEDASAGSPSSSAAPASTSTPPAARKPLIHPKAGKKDIKSLMKGVVVKKKAVPKAAAGPSATATDTTTGGSGTSTPTGTRNGGVSSKVGSASASGSSTPSIGGSSLATANEMRNSQMVGAAGMTALGKRLVQASPSPSPEPSPEPEVGAEAGAAGKSAETDEAERAGKRVKTDP